MAGDGAAVLEDLRRKRVLVLGDVVQLFEQRQVAVALHVAHRARIAVPVPGAAEVAGALDHADLVEPRLAQARAHQKAAEPAADDGDVDVVEHRRAREPRLDVRVVDVVGEVALDLDVLADAVLAQALVALVEVLLVQRVRIEVDLPHHRGNLWTDGHGVSVRSRSSLFEPRKTRKARKVRDGAELQISTSWPDLFGPPMVTDRFQCAWVPRIPLRSSGDDE